MTSYLKLAIAFFALFILQNANAYGPVGHEIIGAIADEKLAHTPAGAKVAALLDGITSDKASTIPRHVGADFFDKEGHPVDPGKTSGSFEDQGGNSLTLNLTSGGT